MRSLKFFLEKPLFIWFLVCVAYIMVFWSYAKPQPPGLAETSVYEVLQTFSESSFPPRITVIRELRDWGHVGYYALMGRLFYGFHGDLTKLRFAHLLVTLFAFFVLITLGQRFTRRNRLNPLWVSLGLLLLAFNPYSWNASYTLSYDGLLLFFSLMGLSSFAADRFGWAGIFTALASLVDWTGLLLPIAFILTRLSEERGRVLRPLRLLYFLFPFVIAALPMIAWNGFLPQGEARQWLDNYREHASFFRPDVLNYALAIFPIYTLWFSWSWAFKARRQAMFYGAIAAAVALPFFFIFSINFDTWAQARSGIEVPLGLIDRGAIGIAGEYKNLLLFFPFMAGVFLLAQLVMMDVLDRSKCLRYFIFLFFLVQPVSISTGDREFFLVLPFIVLLSLSEAMVGEEGNLSSV